MSAKPAALDSLLTLETTFETEGRSLAATAGAAAGLEEGHALGWTAGTALTAELEFYHGAAKALQSLSAINPIPARALENAQQISLLSARVSIPAVGNCPQVDMTAHAESLRALFRRMVVFAHLPGLRYDSKASRLADLSF